MVGRNYASLASVALTIVLLDATQSALGQQALQHPGQVLLVDKSGNKPIELDIKAWPESKETGKQADCPVFGNAPLDATRSESAAGRFQLKVDAKHRTYTTTYCANGIFPRADPDIVNVRNGSPVVPTPVEVYARAGDRATYQAALEQKLTRFIGVLNDLAYYRSINADQFNETIKQLSSTLADRDPNRAKLLGDFSSFVQQWKQ